MAIDFIEIYNKNPSPLSFLKLQSAICVLSLFAVKIIGEDVMLLSRQVRQFIEVARHRSFIRAAEKICVTSSALNHGINELESKLGVKLLNRRHSGVTLTSAGERFYIQVEKFYEREKVILNDLKFHRENMLVVKVDECYYPQISGQINNVMSDYGVNLSFIHGANNHISKEMLAGECDFIINTSFGTCGTVPDDVCRVNLSSERVGVITTLDNMNKYQSPENMLRQGVMIQKSALLQHPLFDDLLARLDVGQKTADIIGLPDILDVYYTINKGVGYSLATEQELQHVCALKMDASLLYKPLGDDLFINRYIYFEKSRYKELIDIAMQFCN